MAIFMLDTDTVSFALRGVGEVAARLAKHKRSELCLSAITVAEDSPGNRCVYIRRRRAGVRQLCRGKIWRYRSRSGNHRRPHRPDGHADRWSCPGGACDLGHEQSAALFKSE